MLPGRTNYYPWSKFFLSVRWTVAYTRWRHYCLSQTLFSRIRLVIKSGSFRAWSERGSTTLHWDNHWNELDFINNCSRTWKRVKQLWIKLDGWLSAALVRILAGTNLRTINNAPASISSHRIMHFISYFSFPPRLPLQIKASHICIRSPSPKGRVFLIFPSHSQIIQALSHLNMGSYHASSWAESLRMYRL